MRQSGCELRLTTLRDSAWRRWLMMVPGADGTNDFGTVRLRPRRDWKSPKGEPAATEDGPAVWSSLPLAVDSGRECNQQTPRP